MALPHIHNEWQSSQTIKLTNHGVYMRKILAFLFTSIALCFSGPTMATGETILIYSYHNHPPFVTGSYTGLTYDLADALNKQAAGRYNFQVSIVPRSRLNYYLKNWIDGKCPNDVCEQNWIVPWVNPNWGFIRGDRDNYLWHPLFTDSNVIVSLVTDSFIYNNPESLKGRVLAGMRGHRYVGIDELVTSGDITRIDGNRERDNIMKVLVNRVTATLLPNSTMQYLLENDKEIKAKAEQLKLGDEKHQIYVRHLMLPETRTDLMQLIENIPVQQLVNIKLNN